MRGPNPLRSLPPKVLKPIGFVTRADGELAAIVLEGDEVQIVKEGEVLGRGYRARRVTEEAVEVAEEAPGKWAPPSSPDRSASADPLRAALPSQRPVLAACPPRQLGRDRDQQVRAGELHKRQDLERSAAARDHAEPATFVFQTLGYVETLAGEIRAVVVENGSVYLVGQGERFAQNYRAISVDRGLVLAIRLNAGWDVEELLSRRTESEAESASKPVYGSLHFFPSAGANLGASREPAVPAGPRLKDFGVDLFSFSGFVGLDGQ